MRASRRPRWAAARFRQVFRAPVRDRLGRARRFGRSTGNSLPVFGLVTPNRGLRRTENPRVDGSIPSLATTSNSLNRMRFPASPADCPWPNGAFFGRPSDFRLSGRCGGGAGSGTVSCRGRTTAMVALSFATISRVPVLSANTTASTTLFAALDVANGTVLTQCKTKHAKVKARLARCPRFHLYFTPPCSS